MIPKRRRRYAVLSIAMIVAAGCGNDAKPDRQAASTPGSGQPAAGALEAPASIPAGTADSATAGASGAPASAPPAEVPGGAAPGGVGVGGTAASPATPALAKQAAPGPSGAPAASGGAAQNDPKAAPKAAAQPTRPAPPGQPAPAPGPVVPGPGSSASGPEVLKIGYVGPLSGPLGRVGRAWMEGASAVLSAANERGGINGTRLQLLVEDDQFDPVQGKRKVQQLIQQGVHGFVGTATPGTAPQALPDLVAANTPVTGGALGFTPIEAGSKVFFPVMQLCDRHMSVAVDYALKQFKAKKFAIFYVDIAAARDCAVAGAKVAQKLGAEMVYEGRVAPGAPDCTPHVVNARSRGAEFVILGVDQLGIVKCKQAALQQGWKVPFVGGYNNIEDSFYKEALGDDGADQIFSGMPFAGIRSPEWEQLCGSPLRRFFPRADPYVIYTIGCLAAHQYLEVLRAIGPGASRAQFIDYLEQGNPIRSNGVAPDMVYRPGDHNPFQVSRPWALRKGKWDPAGDFSVPPQ